MAKPPLPDFCDAKTLRTVIGGRVRAERAWQRLSRAQLASRTNGAVPESYIAGLEQGARIPDVTFLRHLAATLSIELATLIAEPNKEGR